MKKVVYSTRFVRQVARTDAALAELVYEAVEKFKDERNHKALKVHKLKGVLKSAYSFSVTHKVRVVFFYPEKGVAELVMLGSHDDIYRP